MDSLLAALNNPLLYGVLAVGRIRVCEITMTTLSVLCLPITFMLLGFSTTLIYAYVVMIVVRFLITLALVWQSKTYGLKWRDFYTNVVCKILPATIICIVVTKFLNLQPIDIAFLDFLIESSVAFVLHGIVIFLTGFSKEEKTKLIAICKLKVLKRL